MSQPQPSYSRFEIVSETPTEESTFPEAVPVQQQIIQGQNIPFMPQQNPYPQLAPAYYMPVQGPNGLVYMPVTNQSYPIQGQPIAPQGYPQLQPYGYPAPQFQRPEEPSYYERATRYFGNLTESEKFRLRLRIFSIITIIALVFTIRSMFRGYNGHGKILGLINIVLTLVTLRKGAKAIELKSKRCYKGFLKMMGMVFILSIYNAVIFICMAGFRHMGAVIVLFVLAGVEGCLVCRGRRLWKNTLKAEWAGLQDPCAGRGWCCRNRNQSAQC